MPEIVARITRMSEDSTHEHVDLVAYNSPHLGAREPITIDVNRLTQNTWLGDRFFITTPDGEAEVVEGKCPVCGLEPYLRTSADAGEEQKLLDLPSAG